MRMIFILLSALTLCTGCTSYHSLLEGLNERQIKSCIWFTGNAGPWASLRTVSATGGADLHICLGLP